MRNAAIAKRRATSQIRDLLDVRRSHDARVINRDVHKNSVEIDILLRMRVDQVMVVMAGDR